MKSLFGIRIDPWETKKELALKAGIIGSILVLGVVLFYLISLLWGSDTGAMEETVSPTPPEISPLITESDQNGPSTLEANKEESKPEFTLPKEKTPLKDANSIFFATNESVYDLKRRPQDLIVLNPELYPEEDIEFLKVNKNVFAQISAGLADRTKEYWNQRAVYLVDRYSSDLFFVDFSRSAWHEIVINEVVQAKKKGFEGVVLHNVDQGYKRSTEERFLRLRQSSMEDLIKTISSFVHDGRFLVFVDGGEEMYMEILDSIDGVVVEDPLDEEISEKIVVIVRPKG